MTPEHDSLFDALLARLADGVIASDELTRLEQLLLDNRERQRLYYDYLLNHLLLEQEGALRAEADCKLTPRNISLNSTQPQRMAIASARPKVKIVKHTEWRFRGRRFAVAATILLMTGALTVVLMRGESGPNLATVVDSIGVEGAPRELTAEGAALDIGLPLNFATGLVAVAMPSGAQLVIEGPASVMVLGWNRVQLDRGKLFATVPSPAIGFTVETSAASIVDLGTEFGVSARPDGVVETYVFRGKVRAESGNSVATLAAGQAVSASKLAGVSAMRKFHQSEVHFARSVDGTSYLNVVEQLNPLAMYRFSPSSSRRQFPSDFGSVRNSASIQGGVYAAAGGAIVAPNAADGYLRFVGVESQSVVDSVHESLAQTQQYSIVAWVRVDEAGPQGIAAFAGEQGPDRELGAVLRVTSDGLLEHRCHYGPNVEFVRQTSTKPIPRGRWMHVVATGGSHKNLYVYLNGERVAAPIKLEGAIRTDCGRLVLGSGSARSLIDDLHTGPLRGAIDEVAVFDRCLSEAEVQRMYASADSGKN